MAEQVLFAVGSYTTKQGHAPFACGEGIRIVSFDEDKGWWGDSYILGDLKNPSYLDWDNSLRYLYAITESGEGDGRIQVYSLNHENLLRNTSSVTGPGPGGCHLAGDFKRNKMYATSYMDGTLKSYTLKNGNPGDPVFNIRFEGKGPNRDRQESAHAHQVLIHGEKPFVYVCDLGSDRIWLHNSSEGNAVISEALAVPAGYGPRHLAFDPDGEYAFILCELKPRLLVAKINDSDGSMEIVQDLPTADASLYSISAPAAVKVHPSGKTVAVSNRFDDSITVFQIKRERQKISLTLFQNFSSMGKTPRDITFSPSGKWLLIANQDSSDIQVKSFDRESGLPRETWSEPLKTGTPVCIISLD
jgi:6-phosphogluconolactonase